MTDNVTPLDRSPYRSVLTKLLASGGVIVTNRNLVAVWNVNEEREARPVTVPLTDDERALCRRIVGPRVVSDEEEEE